MQSLWRLRDDFQRLSWRLTAAICDAYDSGHLVGESPQFGPTTGWIAYAAAAHMDVSHDLAELLERGDAYLLGLAEPELDCRFSASDLKTWPLPKLLMYLGSMSQAVADSLPNMALQDEVSDSTARLVAIAVTAGERAIAGLAAYRELTDCASPSSPQL